MRKTVSSQDVINKLGQMINGMSNEKRKQNLLKWLDLYCDYVNSERLFDPEKMLTYKPGDVITVNFGFNVGSEFGGRHYAVVLHKDFRTNRTLTVVPLSSCKSKADVKWYNTYLGIIPELNQPPYWYSKITEKKHTFAVINQTRAIDKMRISFPVMLENKKDVFNIGRDRLEKIQRALTKRLNLGYNGNN